MKHKETDTQKLSTAWKEAIKKIEFNGMKIEEGRRLGQYEVYTPTARGGWSFYPVCQGSIESLINFAEKL